MKRGGPLKRYTPLRSKSGLRSTATKRAKPPQGFPPKLPEHERMRDGKARDPNAAEKRHISRIKRLPCAGCGRVPATDSFHDAHHVMRCPGKRRRRDHRFVVPLCPVGCHQGPGSVHGLGSEAAYERSRGLPEGHLAQTAIAEWLKSQGVTTAALLEAAE